MLGKVLLWLLLGSFVGVICADEWKNKIVVIPVKGDIVATEYGGNADAILAAIVRAKNAPVRLLILEIDSPGGMVDVCDKICRELLTAEIPTAALVEHLAVSGGAMVATACQSINLQRGSRIGDIQPMNLFGANMDERTAEKIEADVRAIMAANARANGYPKLLLEAMVSRSFEVYEVSFTDGTREFITAADFALLKNNLAEKIDQREFAAPPKIVVPADKLLSVDATTALELGIAQAVVANRDALFAAMKIAPASHEVIVVPIAAGKFSPLKMLETLPLDNWLMLLLIIFLVVGIAGTLTEIHTPGFGVPGVLGLIGFTCFFYLLFAQNRAEWYELALFILGIILLICEIVLLPGFGVAGVSGIMLLLVGLTLAILPELSGEYLQTHFVTELLLALSLSLGAVVIGGVLVIFFVSRGEKLPYTKKIFLANVLPDWQTAMSASPTSATENRITTAKIYRRVSGVALTDLRPAGKVKLADGTLLDVITNGEFIEKTSSVMVSSTPENHLRAEKI